MGCGMGCDMGTGCGMGCGMGMAAEAGSGGTVAATAMRRSAEATLRLTRPRPIWPNATPVDSTHAYCMPHARLHRRMGVDMATGQQGTGQQGTWQQGTWQQGTGLHRVGVDMATGQQGTGQQGTGQQAPREADLHRGSAMGQPIHSREADLHRGSAMGQPIHSREADLHRGSVMGQPIHSREVDLHRGRHAPGVDAEGMPPGESSARGAAAAPAEAETVGQPSSTRPLSPHPQPHQPVAPRPPPAFGPCRWQSVTQSVTATAAVLTSPVTDCWATDERKFTLRGLGASHISLEPRGAGYRVQLPPTALSRRSPSGSPRIR